MTHEQAAAGARGLPNEGKVRRAAVADAPGDSLPSGTGAVEERATTQQKPKPATILEILELAYSGEGGKRMDIEPSAFRNAALAVMPGAAEVESARLEELAAADPLMAAPLRLLVALAENRSREDVRTRLLDLVQQALANHLVFAGLDSDGVHPQSQRLPNVTARRVRERARDVVNTDFAERVSAEVSEAWVRARAARDLALEVATGSQQQQSELKRKASELQQRALEGQRRLRKQLEFNAVATFALHHVLSGTWTLAEFVAQTDGQLWDRAELAPRPELDAAVLVMATQKRPLGILASVHRSIATDHIQRTQAVQFDLARERARADAAERTALELRAEARDVAAKAADLEGRYDALRSDLAAERDSRVVDKSHLVNDFEVLRTQVLRRLTSQTELLADGLHALRAGSTEVAEEFVDRALTAIQNEITRLKSQGGAR